MPTFTTFNDRLPDPTFKVNDAGAVDAAGSAGPGFAKVHMTSQEDTQVSRTISGRGVHRSNATQYWTISITYNPMTRDEFDVVDTFLQARKGRRKPFFVVLPQYSKSKSSAFAGYAASATLSAAQATAAGSEKLLVSAGAAPPGYPKPGDFITITDSGDINHLKAYKITRVETPTTYQTSAGAPGATQFRLTLNPPLQKFVNNNALINFVNPMFRVMLRGDVLEHELDTENTFEFGLELEEIMP